MKKYTPEQAVEIIANIEQEQTTCVSVMIGYAKLARTLKTYLKLLLSDNLTETFFDNYLDINFKNQEK